MNLILIAIFSALLPVGLLAFYICRKDKDQPEPKKWLVKAGLYGVCSGLLVLIAGFFLLPGFDEVFPALSGTVLGAMGEAFFDAAIPEEAAKLLMLWLLIRKNPFFDEHLDGIVYATCVGLGFAGLENILYLLNNIDSLVGTAVMRAVFSVPGHFFFAVVMGYYVSLACFSSYNLHQRRRYWALALCVPVVLHGIFDSILMSASVIPGIFGLFAVVFIAFCIWLRKYGLKRIAAMKAKDRGSNGVEYPSATVVNSKTAVPDYHAVFIDNGNTVYHFHGEELSIYRIDVLDTPFMKNHVDSFQEFITAINKAIDGNERMYLFHNEGFTSLDSLLGCDLSQLCPETKIVVRTYSEVMALNSEKGRITPDFLNEDAFGKNLMELSLEIQKESIA